MPHKFFNAQYGEPLRALLADNNYLSEIVHFGDEQVFEQATTYTCLLFLDKEGSKQCHLVKVDNLLIWRNTGKAPEESVPVEALTENEWNFSLGNGSELFRKLSTLPTKLGDISRIFQGLVTGADKVFVLEEVNQLDNGDRTVRDQSGMEWILESEILKPFINKITVSTYETPGHHHWIIFPYHLTEDKKAELIPVEKISSDYPKIWSYLQTKENLLRDREGGKWNHAQWYAFGRTQNLTQMSDPKLIIQVISKTGKYAYDQDGIYFTGGGNGPYYGLRWLNENNPHSLRYLQGLLTSLLLDTYLHSISSPFRGGYWSYGKRFIELIPIRTINFSDPTDKARHDRMVEFVERMLSLHKRLADAKVPHEKAVTQQQIDVTEQQIDKLVYELYGLTEEEIETVENDTQR